MYLNRELLRLKEVVAKDFKLFNQDRVAAIYYDKDDFKVVDIAVQDLAEDIFSVTGKKAKVINNTANLSKQMILVGTLGKNKLIDNLVKEKIIDISGIKNNWESFLITTVQNPVDAVEQALVIVGSDRRATAFGVYELAKQIGVSPWSWWADVPVLKKEKIIIKNKSYVYGPPAVKYRGIFINDEDWGLQPWAAKNFEADKGDIGPRTYAKIFELLLRLKANYIWPAMHPCTRAFNGFSANKVIADNYAIVVGSSHCEPMLRNNVGEWNKELFNQYTKKEWTAESWNYQTNPDIIFKYWEDRVKENSQYENTYTVGMRGIHDGGMPGPDSLSKKVKLLEKVISDQRKILKKHIDYEIDQVPQVFCPYKEVLDIYNEGLNLPDDITTLWSNDNFGYLTRLPTAKESKRSGGAGIYYHISYWGRPHDYLWLCTTNPTLIWEEMKKAYQYNARQIWVLNVGDLKPGEFLTEFFLTLGWQIDKMTDKDIEEYISNWITINFNQQYSSQITEIILEFYQLNYIRKPEHLGWNSVYPNTAIQDPEFSIFNYGDEVEKYLNRYLKIANLAEKIYLALEEKFKAAFYQLVLYPVKGAALMAQKMLYAYKNRIYASQGRISANKYARLTKTAYQQLKKATNYYNEKLNNGKWQGIISMKPRQLPVFEMPELTQVIPQIKADYGIILENSQELLNSNHNNKLPAFSKFSQKSYFIDIFNKSDQQINWQAKVEQDWINISVNSGILEDELRLFVSIIWDKIPAGDIVEGEINLSILGEDNLIKLEVYNPNLIEAATKNTFIEINKYIALEAENYSKKVNNQTASWKFIKGLSRTGKGSLAATSVNNSAFEIKELGITNFQAQSPLLEYNLIISTPGEVIITAYFLPTNAVNDKKYLRYAVALDTDDPQLAELFSYTDEYDKTWQQDVLRSTKISQTKHYFNKPGKHKLKIWMVDPGVIIDKIVLDFGGVKPSYLGPAETLYN